MDETPESSCVAGGGADVALPRHALVARVVGRSNNG
jgi:hypothetical protein